MLFYSGVIGHADKEMTVMKGDVFIHSFLEVRGVTWHKEAHAEAPRWSEVEGMKEILGKCSYCGFHGNGQGRQMGLGLAALNNFSRLWGIRAVSSFLVLGPGAIRTGG